MTDPLAALYPSAKPEAAETTDAAPAPSAPAATLYGNTPPSDPSAPAATPPQPSKPSEPPMAETASPTASLYDSDIDTTNHVDWREGAATTAADLKLDWTPHDNGQEPSDEIQGQRDRFEQSLVAAGVGPTFAREIMGDAARASRETYEAVTQDAAMAELQALWGDRFAEKVSSARELIQKAAAANPDIIDYLERTQLGNDPKFIRKLAARAAAETRLATEKAQTRRAFEG